MTTSTLCQNGIAGVDAESAACIDYCLNDPACWSELAMHWAFRFGLLFALVLFVAPALAGEPATTDGNQFFEKEIRPLLERRCYECHSHAKKINGGLALDSRSGWEQGGDSGPAIVPGKPEKSRLIEAIRYTNANLEMPPTGKLPPAEIDALVAWVRRGAPDPRVSAAVTAKSESLEEGRIHWAFQPIRETKPPEVHNAAWPRTDVDRFLLARLEAAGLKPVGDADAYTLLRRLSFDLTGLPPEVEEVEAFIQQFSASPHPFVSASASKDAETRGHGDAENAYTAQVDKLLASPAFGERWARHWLDLVGYADQIGTANNLFAEHAWRYRDYVIDSFNGDKPFDQFVREQIAGDLLDAAEPRERAAQLTATGFLLLGNLDVVESDKAKLRVDVVDQQIEKIGKAFLGLTLNCARCHDHKFDPVRQTDYYALAGIFGSTESVYVTGQGVWSWPRMAPLPETGEEQMRRERRAGEHETQLAALKVERGKLVGERDELAPQLKSDTDASEETRKEREPKRDELEKAIKSLDGRIQHAEFFSVKPPVAFAVREAAEIADARITIRGNAHALGDQVPRGFVQVVSLGPPPGIPSRRSGRLELAEWLTSPQNPLTARVVVNRIWQKLFGQGIVRSVDYFGRRGETPTHPELLDYLAARFVREGWSQKRLIRELVLSRAYQLSSANDTAGAKSDPDNRLLWRMNQVRHDAESLRDAWLAASGELLPSRGGPAMPLEFVENVGNLSPKSVNPPSFNLKTFRPEQPRVRTIYLPVLRSSVQKGPADVLNYFDFPQPAQFVGQRPTTAVPTQALFLLNGPLVKEQSARLASRLLADSSGDNARLKRLWLRTIGRPVTEGEAEDALAFLRAVRETASGAGPPTAEVAVWSQLCQALLMSNEFLFRL